MHMKRGLPFMSGVSKEELGFDEETAAAADDATGMVNADGSRSSSKSKVKQKKPGCFTNTLSMTLNALISSES